MGQGTRLYDEYQEDGVKPTMRMTFDGFATAYFALVKEMFSESNGPKLPGTILHLADLEPDSAMNKLIALSEAHPVFNARIAAGEGKQFATA